MSFRKHFWPLLFILVFYLTQYEVNAQQHKGYTRQATIHEGDTIPYIELPTVSFLAPRQFANRFEEARYRRLVRNVKRAYPYAKIAGVRFQEYNAMLMEIESEAERRRVTRELEKKIRDEFEGELKRLTISQGHILIKLIDRETQNTSYDVLRDFRGAFTAVFWQSLGRLFGYNLKTRYDPHGEDKLIEEIVQLIEQGLI